MGLKHLKQLLTQDIPSFGLLFLILIILSGCQLTYQHQSKPILNIEYAVTDTELDDVLFELDDIRFQYFDTEAMMHFDGQNVLFKIDVPERYNLPANEYTLSVFPKYLEQVHYFSLGEPGQISTVSSQFRNVSNQDRYFSSQRFAFNIDHADLFNTHFLLVKSQHKHDLKIELTDTNSYIKSDAQFSQFFTVIYSLIFALALFNSIYYLYTKEVDYLHYTSFILASIYALLWQEGKINDLPFLAWHVMGVHSTVIYVALAYWTGVIFYLKFMKLKYHKSWLTKSILLIFAVQLLLLITALFQFHLLNNHRLLSYIEGFYYLLLINLGLMLVVVITQVKQKQPQAYYLLCALGLMVVAICLRAYHYLNPDIANMWMPHSIEVATVLQALILAFAIANRAAQLKKQQVQAVNRFSRAEQSVYKKQLLAQFQQEMEVLVKDTTLNAEQVAEKTNIKFHLLLNRAYPIKNSLILEGDHIKRICTTGFDALDVDLLKLKAQNIITGKNGQAIAQKTISTADDKYDNMLFIPLKEHTDPKVTFILSLKGKKSLSTQMLSDIQNYCSSAYDELLQAIQMYQVALATHLDSLTQCHNKTSIESIIKKSLNQKHLTTIAQIDLGGLKQVYEQHGNESRDQCIIEAAHLIENNLPNQVRLGRCGDHLFVVVFSAMSLESCLEIAETVMQSLTDHAFTEHDIKLQCHIGLAESRMNETLSSLMKKVMTALRHAKQTDRKEVSVYGTEEAY